VHLCNNPKEEYVRRKVGGFLEWKPLQFEISIDMGRYELFPVIFTNFNHRQQTTDWQDDGMVVDKVKIM
jgi:hypothetical protein